MKKVELKGTLRKNLGTKSAKEERRDKLVPCVLYGKENVHFTLLEKDIKQIVYTPNEYNVEIDIDGTKYQSIVREFQFHPVTDKVIHIDFLQLFDDKIVEMRLPVFLEGNAIGVRNGGKLRLPMRKLRIKALPKDLPDGLNIDISKMRIGDSIRVGDLSFAGLEFLDNDNNVVVAIKAARGALEDEEEEEEAEAAEGAEGATAEGGVEGGEAKDKEEAAAE